MPNPDRLPVSLPTRRAAIPMSLLTSLLAVHLVAPLAGCSNRTPSSRASASTSASPIAPQINLQPANQSVFVGDNATFAVAATGTEPLSYDWRKDGRSLNAPSSARYTTPSVLEADDNSIFNVVVSNLAGSIASSSARLSVSIKPPQATTIQPQQAPNPIPANTRGSSLNTSALLAPVNLPLSSICCWIRQPNSR